MKKIIGILATPTIDDENDALLGLYNNYKNVIIENDCIPFMIPPVLNIDYYNTRLRDIPELTSKEKEMYDSMLDICTALLLPGGYKMYDWEKYVTTQALKKNMPILGICKGMQILSAIDNNERCLERNNTTINHHQKGKKYVHKLNIVNGTILSSIINKNVIMVNSKHRFHVTKVNQFKVSAYSPDGLIEAIESPKHKFVLGVQWHPEAINDSNADKIFKRFIKEADGYNKTRNSIDKN